MVTIKTLSQKNPEYSCDTELLDSLYDGNIKTEKHLGESSTQSWNSILLKNDISKQCYDNYFAQIINYYVGFLFKDNYNVELENEEEIPDFYKDFLYSSDKKGTDFTEFLKKQVQQALLHSRGYVNVGIPEIPKGITKGEYEEYGLGDVKVTGCKTADVLDWSYDENDQLEWVITHNKESVRVSPTSERDQYIETWTIYDKVSINQYSVQYKENSFVPENTEIKKTYELVHNLGEVPIVPICLSDGMTIGKQLKPLQLRHLRSNTAYQWSIYRTTYSVPVLKVENKESASSIFNKQSSAIVIGKDDDFDWSTPPSNSIKDLADCVKNAKEEMFSISSLTQLLNSRNSSYLGSSGLSKEIDKGQSDISLNTYKSIIKEVMEKTLNMIAKIRGEDYIFKVNVVPDIKATELAELLNSVDIPEPAKTELFKRLAQLLNLDEEIIEQMEIPEPPKTIPVPPVVQEIEEEDEEEDEQE